MEEKGKNLGAHFQFQRSQGKKREAGQESLRAEPDEPRVEVGHQQRRHPGRARATRSACKF